MKRPTLLKNLQNLVNLKKIMSQKSCLIWKCCSVFCCESTFYVRFWEMMLFELTCKITELRGPPSLIPFTTSPLHHPNLLARYSQNLLPRTHTQTSHTHTNAQTARVIQADSSHMTVCLWKTHTPFYTDIHTRIANMQPIFAPSEADGHEAGVHLSAVHSCETNSALTPRPNKNCALHID